jgi:hypothetical protein
MAMCSPDYVRSKIKTTTLTDLDISNIITETSEEVRARCGTTDETNPIIILAVKYAVLAATLTRMKTTGELTSLRTANSQRTDTPDIDIKRYEQKSEALIEEFKRINSYTFSSPSFTTGFSSHHGGHHGFN